MGEPIGWKKARRRPDAAPFHDTGLFLRQTIHIPERGLTARSKGEACRLSRGLDRLVYDERIKISGLSMDGRSFRASDASPFMRVQRQIRGGIQSGGAGVGKAREIILELKENGDGLWKVSSRRGKGHLRRGSFCVVHQARGPAGEHQGRRSDRREDRQGYDSDNPAGLQNVDLQEDRTVISFTSPHRVKRIFTLSVLSQMPAYHSYPRSFR